MRFLLQDDEPVNSGLDQSFQGDPGFTDSAILDEFQFDFGEWVRQIVFWTNENLKGLLDAIAWPFRFLFDLILSDDPTASSIESIPWYWVAIFFFIIGSIARNTRVGVMAGLMVGACGMLGPDYWSVTTKTFGMVFISVLLCAIIGVPLGILCGRIDAVWKVVRPTLDAMQVVHSFVFMLPFIFFWGIGEVSATMVTMVFALPPLVRLTNLGIRQVPEDVVEASRSYGASERRVLTDVQLPLARPAIMTGLNQTLLLAISMLGIAALMGAGGLGAILYRAIGGNNLAAAAGAGLAYFLVAVVLDRISQREHDDGVNLLQRMREAWNYRREPEALLELHGERAEAVAQAQPVATEPAERPEPVSSGERIGLLIAAAGFVGVLVSLILPWARNGGIVAAWGRRADETELVGQSFMGIEASGGTLFAIFAGLFAFVGLAAALRPLFSFGAGPARTVSRIMYVLFGLLGVAAVTVWALNLFGIDFSLVEQIALIVAGVAIVLVVVETWLRGTDRLGADGALIMSLGALGAAVGYLLLQPKVVSEYSHGIGLWIALIGAAAAIVGGLLALGRAPYSTRRPFKLEVGWPAVIGVVFAIALMTLGSFSWWVVDGREDALVTPEMQAEIDRLTEEAGNDINKQIANGQAITNLINSAKLAPPTFGGLSADGPGLGWPTLGFGALAGLAALVSAGLLGGTELRRWRAATVAAGLALGATVIPLAWILSFTRSAEPNAISGVGTFFALSAGLVLFAIGRGVIGEFRRRKIYAELTPTASPVEPSVVTEVSATVDEAAEAVLVGGAGE